MRISLNRINENFGFEVKDTEGHTMVIDTGLSNGGNNLGFTPMQLLLIGAAGCSAIDMVHILKKQRQEISSFNIEVEGQREKVEEYSVWKKIHLIYTLHGNIDKEKALRAAALSHEKYCSVSKALSFSSSITFEVRVMNQT
jgi:putative redox protein